MLSKSKLIKNALKRSAARKAWVAKMTDVEMMIITSDVSLIIMLARDKMGEAAFQRLPSGAPARE